MQIIGANPAAPALGQEQLPGIVNYFIGNDPSQWHANIPTFGRVAYQDVYPGIDLVYYGGQSPDREGAGLEYDFIVSPGADPSAITLNFAGADGVEINPRGDLVLHTAAGDVVQQKPLTYQEKGGTRQEVTSRYALEGNSLRFALGAYDATRPLVIDPLVMGYSTYVGGASGFDLAWGIAVDSAGNAYLSAYTSSIDFPTTPGAFDTTFNGGIVDAAVVKLNADGTALVYGTYLGGGSPDSSRTIAVDLEGNAYVTGTTSSIDFPTTPNAFDTSSNGDDDAYVTKLNADGSAILYSTFLGGSGYDHGNGVAVDTDGNAYVTGITVSPEFPTTPGAFDTTYNEGNEAFVTKLNAGGSALVYSTYLGGSNSDSGYYIALDAGSNAHVVGIASSTNFPTTPGAFDTTYNGGFYDAFATKFNEEGSALVYSTYVGGISHDLADGGMALDVSGNVYFTGYTRSGNFPTTPGAFDTTFGGSDDGYVTKLIADGSALAYSTFLGGSGTSDFGEGVAVDADGNAYVTGGARGVFPTTPDAFDTTYNGGGYDGIFMKFDLTGSNLLYSTYLGGGRSDFGSDIALDMDGNAYVTGITDSTNFPTTPGALKRRNRGGGYEAFVTKFTEM